jgi:hypothetical protein
MYIENLFDLEEAIFNTEDRPTTHGKYGSAFIRFLAGKGTIIYSYVVYCFEKTFCFQGL